MKSCHVNEQDIEVRSLEIDSNNVSLSTLIVYVIFFTDRPISMQMYSWHTHAYTLARTCIVRVCMYIYRYICMCICHHVYIRTQMYCACVYICMYAYAHPVTYIHTYISFTCMYIYDLQFFSRSNKWLRLNPMDRSRRCQDEPYTCWSRSGASPMGWIGSSSSSSAPKTGLSHASPFCTFRSVIHMSGSYHIDEWVIWHVWLDHATQMNETCHRRDWFKYAREWVTSHMWMSHSRPHIHTCSWSCSWICVNSAAFSSTSRSTAITFCMIVVLVILVHFTCTFACVCVFVIHSIHTSKHIYT